MKEIAYLMLGAAIGATLALLFAPKSGAELRADLQLTAQEDKAKMQAQWQATMDKTDQKLSQVDAELKQVDADLRQARNKASSEAGSEAPA